MGAIIEDLDDPEGYALWRLADGSVIPAWSSGVSEFSGYVARCACGCHAQRQHPPTEAGYEQAIDQWVDEHALAELARQASRRREDLGRVLAWFGTQAGRLQDPASLDRPVAWIAPASSSSSSSVTWTARRPSGRPTVSGDRPLAVWSDRRIGEHGRAICQQRTLPTHPGLAGEQAAVLEEWARRWRQRGPHDLPGQVELGLLEDIAAELRRIATGIVRQPSPHGRSTVSAERPSTPSPTQLGEDQGLPGEFLVGFTERLLDRRAELLAESQAPAEAREQAVAEAVQAFAAGAIERGWTVTERRIASLADDTLGLEAEYRDQHGYEPPLARRSAIGEVLDGERAREELPSAWLRQPDPPARSDPTRQGDPSQRTGPDGRPDRVRTREAGRER